MVEPADSGECRVVGRYSIHAEIAHGGMATVHVGRLMGPGGFSRTVAVKRLHPMFAKDPEFVSMFMDEARLAARIQHPNVVSIIDVVAERGELLLVMDYIQGESLSRLLRAERARGGHIEPRIAVKIMTEVLSGLHAAHEVRNERGVPLGVVHRDVSPQNILIGVNGVAQLIDFGVAKAAGRSQDTRDGHIKGKLPYMAPEQIRAGAIDRRTDIYAAAAVLWEILVGRRLFTGDDANLMYAVLSMPIPAPSVCRIGLSSELDATVLKGLQRNPAKRPTTALEMADALERALAPASSREVAQWMGQLAATALERRANVVAEVECRSDPLARPGGAAEDSLHSDWLDSGRFSHSSDAAASAWIGPGSVETQAEVAQEGATQSGQNKVPGPPLPVAPYGAQNAIDSSTVAPELPTDVASTISTVGFLGRRSWRWVFPVGAALLLSAVGIWLYARSPTATTSLGSAAPSSLQASAQGTALSVASQQPSSSAALLSNEPASPQASSGATASGAKSSKAGLVPLVPTSGSSPPVGPKKKVLHTRD